MRTPSVITIGNVTHEVQEDVYIKKSGATVTYIVDISCAGVSVNVAESGPYDDLISVHERAREAAKVLFTEAMSHAK